MIVITNKTDTRSQILNTAAILFRNKGYHATGLNEIIRESGAPKGCLYYYFPKGKEQLAQEAIKLVGREIQAKMENVFNEYSDPVLAIQKFIQESATNIFNRDQSNRFSVSLLALETVNMNEFLRQTCRDVFDSWTDIFYRKLTSGGFSEADARKFSTMIVAMIEGVMTVSLIRKEAGVMLEFADLIPVLLKER